MEMITDNEQDSALKMHSLNVLVSKSLLDEIEGLVRRRGTGYLQSEMVRDALEKKRDALIEENKRMFGEAA